MLIVHLLGVNRYFTLCSTEYLALGGQIILHCISIVTCKSVALASFLFFFLRDNMVIWQFAYFFPQIEWVKFGLRNLW